MERDNTPRWKKKAGGSHRTRDGRVLGAGDILRMSIEEMEMSGFKDQFTLLDPAPTPEEQKPKAGLKMVHKGGGRYIVINEVTGEPLTDELLSRAQAEQFVGDDAK